MDSMGNSVAMCTRTVVKTLFLRGYTRSRHQLLSFKSASLGLFRSSVPSVNRFFEMKIYEDEANALHHSKLFY